jgi:hypothetical protein
MVYGGVEFYCTTVGCTGPMPEVRDNRPSQHCPNCEALAAENERLRDEVVELWHQAPSEERSLQECLGMDIEQYVAWGIGDLPRPKPKTKP